MTITYTEKGEIPSFSGEHNHDIQDETSQSTTKYRKASYHSKNKSLLTTEQYKEVDRLEKLNLQQQERKLFEQEKLALKQERHRIEEEKLALKQERDRLEKLEFLEKWKEEQRIAQFAQEEKKTEEYVLFILSELKRLQQSNTDLLNKITSVGVAVETNNMNILDIVKACKELKDKCMPLTLQEQDFLQNALI